MSLNAVESDRETHRNLCRGEVKGDTKEKWDQYIDGRFVFLEDVRIKVHVILKISKEHGMSPLGFFFIATPLAQIKVMGWKRSHGMSSLQPLR